MGRFRRQLINVPSEMSVPDAANAFYTAINTQLADKLKAGELKTDEEAKAAAESTLTAFGKAADEAGEKDFPTKFSSEYYRQCKQRCPAALNKHASAFHQAIKAQNIAKYKAFEFKTEEESKAAAKSILAAFGKAAGEAGESDFPEK